MRLKPFTPKHFRRRVFSQLWMLALQFILGMMLNLIGTDSKGRNHAVYKVVLIAHILNALGLLEGGMYIALKNDTKLATSATLAISVTFLGGALTVITKSTWWSFVMAAGFIVSGWLYVMLYIRADRLLRGKDEG